MDKIFAECLCGRTKKSISARCYHDSVHKYGRYKCLKCIIEARGSKNGEAMRNKQRQLAGILNHDIIKVACAGCPKEVDIQFQTLKQYKKKHNTEIYYCADCMNRRQDRSKSKTPEHRAECSRRSKAYENIPGYVEKRRKHLAEVRSLGPGASNLERSVWKLLDDLGVKFIAARDDIEPNGRSFVLGYWSFDIMIPSSERIENNKDLLIEIDGYYKHSRDDVVGYDKSKESYVANLADKYDFIRILEHEFLSIGKIKNRILSAIGKLQIIEPQHIELCDLLVKQVECDQTYCFFGAYHYIGYANKRGFPVGCINTNGELIAAALFTGITRNQSATRFGLKSTECRELIRFCISPLYHNKNLGSWFLSRAIKLLSASNENIKLILTFADPSVGHTGGLYRACNFIDDGVTNESYVYLSSDGYIMHKKTMWDHASRNSISESMMAEKSGYQLIKTQPKHRFIYEIK